MRIVLVSMNFAPELTGIGKYSGELAEGLVDRGHRIVAVCAPPYYPAWRVSDGHSAWRWRVERPRPGLTVVRCPTWVPQRPAGGRRLLHLLSFALSAAPVTLALALWRPAVLFAVAPNLFTAPAAVLAARLCGARAQLHVQDFELDAAFELGLLKGPLLRRAAGSFERVLMRTFDCVSTLSRRMRERLLAKGVAPERATLFPNGVELQSIRPRADRSPGLRAELGIAASQTVFLFAGTMNRKQGLPVLFDALDRLGAREDIVLVLAGQGEMRAEVEAAAAMRPPVRLLPLMPIERLEELLNLADVHLLPQLADAADLVLPSKLTGMLASGRPVIATAHAGTEIADLLREGGLVVAPEDAAAVAAAMTRLADDADLRKRLGHQARVIAEQSMDRDHLLDVLIASFACEAPSRWSARRRA